MTVSIDDLKNNPKLFFEKILGLVPHPGQAEVLDAFLHHQTTVLCCGRKWGKSFLAAGLLVWFAVTNPASRCFVVAPSLRQAKLVWERTLEFLETSKLRKLVKKSVEFPFPRIDLLNGSSIHAFGATSDHYLRGEEAHFVVIDEAAFVRPKTITDVIEPMLLVTGGKMLLVSTPFGRNLFYHYFMRGQDSSQNHYWSKRYASYENPYHNKEFLEEQRLNSSNMKWRTEYEAEFLDNELALFRWEYIEAAMRNYPYVNKRGDCLYPVEPKPSHQYVIGVDWARTTDFTVASCLDVTEEPFVLVNHYRNRKLPWSILKDDVRDLAMQYNAELCIDATSLGETLVEEFPDFVVTGYKMSNDRLKYELIQKLVRNFEYKKIAIPDIPELIDELKYFELVVLENNKTKMEAKKGHDDWVISLALANWIANSPNDIAFFQSFVIEE